MFFDKRQAPGQHSKLAKIYKNTLWWV